MVFILLPMSDVVWAEFASWYETRGIAEPPRPPDGIFVAVAEEGEAPVLVGGCCLYPCDGPFVIAEYASFLPGISKRVYPQAVAIGITALRSYATLRSKAVFVFPRRALSGFVRALRRGGFLLSDAVCMFSLPGLNTGVAWEKRKAPSQGIQEGAGPIRGTGKGPRPAPRNVSTTSRKVKGGSK